MKIIVIFVAFFAAIIFAELELSHEECKEIGFNPETLKCSACEKLSQFQLEEILTDCQRCCTKDITETHEVKFLYYLNLHIKKHFILAFPTCCL